MVSIELDKLCKWFQVNKLSLNTPKTNFMVFTDTSCDDTYTVCMNGLNLSRVFVTKFLGVHNMDSKLDWKDHINIVRNKIAKNVSVMNRVKHVLTSSALYSLYCTLVMPYLTYCCEVWGNNYTPAHPIIVYSTEKSCFINLDHLMFLTLLTLKPNFIEYPAIHTNYS